MIGRRLAILATSGIAALVYVGGTRTYLDRPRAYAPETSALKDLQTLNTAQVQYNSQSVQYARSLIELGPSASKLVPADLAAGEKQGYRFTLTPTSNGYSIQAVPTVFGSTGSRTFYTDQSLIIRENYGPEPTTSDSQEVGSATKQH